jgi:hypothetical protein
MEDTRGKKTEEEDEGWEYDEKEEEEQEGRFFLARARRTATSSNGSGAASGMGSRRQGESRHMANATPASARALKAVAAAAARAAAAAPAPESKPSQSSGRLDKATRRQLEMELVYLRDPVKLADRVRSLLSSNSSGGSGSGDMDKAEKAANLVRLASKRYPCTVSWNHLINDQMQHGRVNAALKLFNEVSVHRPVCLPLFIALLAYGCFAGGWPFGLSLPFYPFYFHLSSMFHGLASAAESG